MSRYPLNDETAIDVLIFWIESADGSISFAEQSAVKRVLDTMKYDLRTYQQTFSQLGAMSSHNIKEIIDEAIAYVKSNFSDDGKKLVYSLLDSIANCDAKATKNELLKLDHLKEELGV